MQDYTIKDFTVGNYLDSNGNSWCNVIFKEYGEPLIWVVKDPSKVTLGTQVYGEIKEFTNRNGKTNPRFYKLQKPDEVAATGSSSASKTASEGSSSYEPGTNARWAIGLAYRAYINVMGSPEGADGEFPFDAVEHHARELVTMFESIKNNESSGYEKAKATAKSIGERQEIKQTADELFPGEEDMPVEDPR